MLQPSSDDGTMMPVTGRMDTSTSVIVANYHVTMTPVNAASYFYTNFGCIKANGVYGGIGLTICAPAGTVITVELQTSKICTTDNLTAIDITSTNPDLTFDGTGKFSAISFSKFLGLDTDRLVSLFFSGFRKAMTLGPISFYCLPPFQQLQVHQHLLSILLGIRVPTNVGLQGL